MKKQNLKSSPEKKESKNINKTAKQKSETKTYGISHTKKNHKKVSINRAFIKTLFIREENITRILFGLGIGLILGLILYLVIVNYIAASKWTFFFIYALIILPYIHILETYFSLESPIFKTIKLLASVSLGLLAIQTATPLFMLKIGIIYGDATHGCIHENYTSALRTVTSEVELPLFLTRFNNFNCREYTSGDILEVNEKTTISPITFKSKNSYSDRSDINRSIEICLKDDSRLDSWGFSKISMPVDVYFWQQLKFNVNSYRFNMLGNNTITLKNLGEETDDELIHRFFIRNAEKIPIRVVDIFPLFRIESNTTVSNQLDKLLKRCSSVHVFYTLNEKDGETISKYPLSDKDKYPISIDFPHYVYDADSYQYYYLHFKCDN